MRSTWMWMLLLAGCQVVGESWSYVVKSDKRPVQVVCTRWDRSRLETVEPDTVSARRQVDGWIKEPNVARCAAWELTP